MRQLNRPSGGVRVLDGGLRLFVTLISTSANLQLVIIGALQSVHEVEGRGGEGGEQVLHHPHPRPHHHGEGAKSQRRLLPLRRPRSGGGGNSLNFLNVGSASGGGKVCPPG